MKLSGLYAVTDPELLPGEHLYAAAEAALQGGVALLQYRDKAANPQQREARARRLLELCERFGVPLIINDDLQLAHALGCGVHLGREDAQVEQARSMLGPAAIIGVSCYNELARAEAAARGGATYVAFGRFFPSRTKPGEIYADVALIPKARELGVAVAAIGGITADNGRALVEAGADLLAVVNDVFAANDVQAAAARFAGLFEQ